MPEPRQEETNRLEEPASRSITGELTFATMWGGTTIQVTKKSMIPQKDRLRKGATAYSAEKMARTKKGQGRGERGEFNRLVRR